jgi:hypothetical protein
MAYCVCTVLAHIPAVVDGSDCSVRTTANHRLIAMATLWFGRGMQPTTDTLFHGMRVIRVQVNFYHLSSPLLVVDDAASGRRSFACYVAPLRLRTTMMQGATSTWATFADVQRDLIAKGHSLEVAFGGTVKLFTPVACGLAGMRGMIPDCVPQLCNTRWPNAT